MARSCARFLRLARLPVLQIGAAVSQVVTNYALVKYGAMMAPSAPTMRWPPSVVGPRGHVHHSAALIGMSIAVQPLGLQLRREAVASREEDAYRGHVGRYKSWHGAGCHHGVRCADHRIGITDAAPVDLSAFALRVNPAFAHYRFQIVGSNYFQATGQPTKSIIPSP